MIGGDRESPSKVLDGRGAPTRCAVEQEIAQSKEHLVLRHRERTRGDLGAAPHRDPQVLEFFLVHVGLEPIAERGAVERHELGPRRVRRHAAPDGAEVVRDSFPVDLGGAHQQIVDERPRARVVVLAVFQAPDVGRPTPARRCVRGRRGLLGREERVQGNPRAPTKNVDVFRDRNPDPSLLVVGFESAEVLGHTLAEPRGQVRDVMVEQMEDVLLVDEAGRIEVGVAVQCRVVAVLVRREVTDGVDRPSIAVELVRLVRGMVAEDVDRRRNR